MVTRQDLGIILLGLGGVGMLGYGFLSVLAGSINPSVGADAAESQGKFLIIAGGVCAGIALIIGVSL